jgi:hypothetical protein
VISKRVCAPGHHLWRQQLTLNQRVQGSSPCANTELSSFSWMLPRDSMLLIILVSQSVPNVYPGDQDGSGGQSRTQTRGTADCEPFGPSSVSR